MLFVGFKGHHIRNDMGCSNISERPNVNRKGRFSTTKAASRARKSKKKLLSPQLGQEQPSAEALMQHVYELYKRGLSLLVLLFNNES